MAVTRSTSVRGGFCCRRNRRWQLRAFSMIELLIVIMIITLLVALLVPVVGRVRDLARVVNCASNLRQVVSMLRMYCTEHDGRLPYQALGLEDWSAALTPLGADGSAFTCPADDNLRRDTPGGIAARSYGVNNGPFPVSLTGPPKFRAPWPVVRDALPERLHQVPGHVFVVGDNRGQFEMSAAWVGVSEAEALDGSTWGTHRIKNRRGDNYAFSDGRVEYRIKHEIDQLTADPDADPAGGPEDPWKWR